MVSLQHHALMEELNRNKKDFEEIIRAKNKELEETKVRNKIELSISEMRCCSSRNGLFNVCLDCVVSYVWRVHGKILCLVHKVLLKSHYQIFPSHTENRALELCGMQEK